jgi:hypothetical protein
MTEREYVPLEIIAYRVECEDGWRIGETQRDLDAFRDTLVAKGDKVTEVRSILRGAQRAGLKEDDGKLNDMGYHMVISHGWTFDSEACCWRAPEEMVCQIPGEPVVVEDVEVTFGAAEAGWQPVSIAAGGKAASFDASHVFDPFSEILAWLETIGRGQQGRVSADLEGIELELFAFARPDPAHVRVVVAFFPGRGDEMRDIELDIDVDRRRFISAFYTALRTYSESDRYVVDEYGSLSMRDDLIRKGCPGDPTQLAQYDAAFLNEFLWKLYPRYLVSFPDAPDKGQELVQFAEYAKSKQRPDGMVEVPDPEFTIPTEFDEWPDEQRLAHINELLEVIITPYSGTNLRTLRSETLETFLGFIS